MTDEEYLKNAGITDTAAEAPTPSTPEGSAPATGSPEATAGAGVPSKPAAPTEVFELSGKKYPVNTEFALTHDGKILKVPYSKLANVYRQHTNFQDKQTKWNEEKSAFEKQKAEYEAALEFKKKYGHIQEWSEKNPQDWQVLYELYQDRMKHLLAAKMGQNPAMNPIQNSAVGANPAAAAPNMQPLIDEIANLKGQLSKYDQAYSEYKTDKQVQQEKADTEIIKGEIAAFQKDYPEIKLDERDPDGVALWAKIIQWGLQQGFTKFEPAATMYLKDRVKDAIAARARAEFTKGLKADKQAGIVRRSSTPSSGQGTVDPNSLRKMSWGQVAELSKQQVANGDFNQ